MRHFSCYFLLALLVFSSFGERTFALSWKVSFGSGRAQVGYYNSSLNPKIEEASSLGPMAFRIHSGDAWIADSIGGKIVCLDSDGKPRHTVIVPNLPDNTLLEDFALVPGKDGKVSKILVADGADLFVRAIKVPEGNELFRVGGPGEGPGHFLQIHQIEVSASGRFYVGDYGRRVISVFDETGKFLKEFPWERNGFSVTGDDLLSTLSFNEATGYVWRSFNSKGQLESSVHLGFVNFQNPRLWANEQGGGILVSFVPPGGFRGTLDVVRFSKHGGVEARTKIRPPQAMNRFIDRQDSSHFWLAQANFDAAPKGAFNVFSIILRRPR
ncbi:hypothetical protein HYY75_12270 [bacterium]|nr:hypothetical protein [bacterium]